MSPDEHNDLFKDRMLNAGFYTEDQMMHVRMNYAMNVGPVGGCTQSELKDVVEEETLKIENTLNVVTSVVVEGPEVHAVFLLGQTADEDMVHDAVSKMRQRVHRRLE